VLTLSRDGVALAFTDEGQGGPPLLFVHGWACDRAFFAPQLAHFRPSHRVVAVDLRGHGASDKPEQEYTLQTFVDDLVWVCGQLGIKRPVVVGHSMGAAVALLLAGTHPDLPSAIVMIDGGIRTLAGDATTSSAVLATAPDLTGEDYREAVRDIVRPMFLPTADPELRQWIVERMLRTPRHVLASARRHLMTTNLTAAATACTVPVLYIQAASPRPELSRFQELCPRLVIGRTVGAGHFNVLEVPAQVSAMITSFLATSLPPRAPSS
jgi:pimeloyl-ACP methyl ester carboxylesterase